MKRVRQIGTGLFLAGWVAALVLRYALPEPSAAYLVAGGIAMVGIVMVISAGLVRLFKGKVQLRPLAAMKRMPLLFLLYLAIWGGFHLAFPDDERDLTLALVNAATFAIVLSLYSTAYRKAE